MREGGEGGRKTLRQMGFQRLVGLCRSMVEGRMVDKELEGERIG